MDGFGDTSIGGLFMGTSALTVLRLAALDMVVSQVLPVPMFHRVLVRIRFYGENSVVNQAMPGMACGALLCFPSLTHRSSFSTLIRRGFYSSVRLGHDLLLHSPMPSRRCRIPGRATI